MQSAKNFLREIFFTIYSEYMARGWYEQSYNKNKKSKLVTGVTIKVSFYL